MEDCKKEVRTVLFDLDGTLIRSEFGVIDSAKYALEKCGIPVEDRNELRKFIGPSLFWSFSNFYGMEEAAAQQAVAWYREFYEREGIYMSPLFEGVVDMLEALKKEGKVLAVVTSKPLEYTEIVLRHTKVRTYFSGVFAPDKSVRKCDKAELVRQALRELPAGQEETIMVGDRRFDIEGANGGGVRSVGVLYGYGSREELETAGATYFAETPAGVVDLCL